MVQAPHLTQTLDHYQLRLPMFEGPLDVLLRLIERNQLEITDVSLVQVTDQFLDYVASLTTVPPETLADFTSTASRLLLLKSRSLLPRTPVAEEPEPDELTKQLIEYQAVKKAAEHLKERLTTNQRSFQRASGPPADLEPVQHLKPVAPGTLLQALVRCFARRQPDPERFTPRPIISLRDMTQRILQRLINGPTSFSRLLTGDGGRSEFAVGFIALLSLRKQQQIEAQQNEMFGEIYITSSNTDLKYAADD